MMLLDYWSNVADRKLQKEGVNSSAKDLGVTVEEVFYTYTPLVYRVARRVLGNEADAEDVAQEVLLQLLRKIDSFRGSGRLEAWLHRVTVNAALSYRRKHNCRQRQVDVLLQVLPAGKKVCGAAAPDKSPDQRALDKEMRGLIERAIARLPQIYRDVYVLADIEGLSNAKIGEKLCLGVQAVKSRLHRARLMMREAVAAHCREETGKPETGVRASCGE